MYTRSQPFVQNELPRGHDTHEEKKVNEERGITMVTVTKAEKRKEKGVNFSLEKYNQPYRSVEFILLY